MSSACPWQAGASPSLRAAVRGPMPAGRGAKPLKWAPVASDVSSVIHDMRTVPEGSGSSPVDQGVAESW